MILIPPTTAKSVSIRDVVFGLNHKLVFGCKYINTVSTINTNFNSWGTAVEHNIFYQYQLTNAKNVFMGMIQTETPYFQSNPNALLPYAANPEYRDPTFTCAAGSKSCAKAWGLRIVDSSDVLIYGAGLYSFFDNYDQST